MACETTHDIEAVNQSYFRCCNSESFFDDFYYIFLNSSPKIAPMFAKTDFSKQKQLLRHGITMMLMFHRNLPLSKAALDRLGKSHNRDGYNVLPEMYQFWENSLILAIRKHDPEFSPELEKAWRSVLQKGLTHLKSMY